MQDRCYLSAGALTFIASAMATYLLLVRRRNYRSFRQKRNFAKNLTKETKMCIIKEQVFLTKNKSEKSDAG